MPPTATASAPSRVSNQTRFSDLENAGIAKARTEFPHLGQRTLATKVYADFSRYNINSSRTEVSIAHAIRRFDKQAKADKAAKQVN